MNHLDDVVEELLSYRGYLAPHRSHPRSLERFWVTDEAIEAAEQDVRRHSDFCRKALARTSAFHVAMELERIIWRQK